MEQLTSEKVKLNARFFVVVVAINHQDLPVLKFHKTLVNREYYICVGKTEKPFLTITFRFTRFCPKMTGLLLYFTMSSNCVRALDIHKL